MGFNKIIMQGNLTRDVELSYIQNGSALGKTALAVNRKYNVNGQTREDVCFIDITFWGRTAEVANQYLKKGSPILIEGRLQFDQWQDQNGQNRSKHSITVEAMQMLGGGNNQNQGQNNYQPNQGNYQGQDGGQNNFQQRPQNNANIQGQNNYQSQAGNYQNQGNYQGQARNQNNFQQRPQNSGGAQNQNNYQQQAGGYQNQGQQNNYQQSTQGGNDGNYEDEVIPF